MAVRIRLQNFQSFRDSEIEVSGFVALAGPNNAGKSAVARAIRGLFLNSPAEGWVRKGETSMRVEVEFGDGAKVAWGRDRDRPYYDIGGAVIYPGRDVPPEVLALGVRPIEVGAEKYWPNFGRQFDPPFLVERGGTSLAEAVSDPERVAKLSQAVRCLEQDLRALRASTSAQQSEVDRKRAELVQMEERVRATSVAEDLSLKLRQLRDVSDRLRAAKEVAGRLRVGQDRVTSARRLASVTPPDSGRLRELLDKVGKARAAAVGLNRAELGRRHAAQAATVPIPETSRLRDLLQRKREAEAASARIKKAASATRQARSDKLLAEQAAERMQIARAQFLAQSPSCPLCEKAL